MKILLKKTADDIYTTVVRIPEKSIYTTVLQIDNAQGWSIYTRRSCELYKGILFTQSSANRQRIRMGYIYDGRVNYIREFYYTTVHMGGGYLANRYRVLFISQFWWFTNDIPWYIEFISLKTCIQKILHLPPFSYKVSNLTGFFLAGSPPPLLKSFVVKVLLAGFPTFSNMWRLIFLVNFFVWLPSPLWKMMIRACTVHYLKGIKWYEAVSLFIFLNYAFIYVHLKGACWRILLNN